jgi:integrase
MRNKTMSGEFTSVKSIHAIRRTVNSNLKCNGVSTTVASSLLGHTERVNETNYTYDVSGMAEKLIIIEQMQERFVEGTLGNPKGTLLENKKSL